MKLLIEEEKINEMNVGNPYRERWHQERLVLKKYLINYGQVMLSRENGKHYKVILDTFLSNAIGVNYCICIQWDTMTNDAGEIIYVRAFDKFTPI